MIRPALATRDTYIYVHKNHGELVPKLSNTLTEMKKDGSYSSYEKKYLLPIKIQ